MDRRVFLRLTGTFAATAAAFQVLPAAAQGTRLDTAVTPQPPARPTMPAGLYQFAGRVSLQQPHVSITGITNAQQISWAGDLARAPSASFSSFEYFSEPWTMPDVRVSGGRLESLAVKPFDFA